MKIKTANKPIDKKSAIKSKATKSKTRYKTNRNGKRQAVFSVTEEAYDKLLNLDKTNRVKIGLMITDILSPKIIKFCEKVKSK